MPEITVEQALERAEAHAARGEEEQARRYFGAVLHAFPDNVRARQRLEHLNRSSDAPAEGRDPLQDLIDQLVELIRQGQPAAAAQQAKAMVETYPKAVVLWNILGVSAAQTGQWDLAEQGFCQASKINPEFFEAHNNLGNALKEQGRLDEAIEAYDKALKINPTYIVAQNNIGLVLQSKGRFEEAVEAHARALEVKPDYAEAYNHRGMALRELGRSEVAAEDFENALKHAPDFVAARNNLGLALKNQGRLGEAIAMFEQVVKTNPEYHPAHSNMGNALREQGRNAEAVGAYRKALSVEPESAETHNHLGVALQDEGRIEDALMAYRRAVEIDPDYAEAYRHISLLQHFSAGDAEIPRMERLYGKDGLGADARCSICFALAKAFEDLGDLEKSFAFFMEGNAARKGQLNYDIAQDEAYFAAIRAAAGSSVTSRVSSAAAKPVPIFIVGMPRSGTSLVEQILSAHSCVAGGGELTFAETCGAALALGKLPRTETVLREFRENYLSAVSPLADGSDFVTDKTPQNFLFVGAICHAIPDARIVHVVRDPAATCWSNFRQYFSTDALGYCYDLKDVIRYYCLYRDLMDFWQQKYSDRIYHLDYDELTVNQEARTRALIGHLGLEWEDTCLAPQDNHRVVRTLSQQQVTQKVYSGSSQKWRAFEPLLDGVFDGLQRGNFASEGEG